MRGLLLAVEDEGCGHGNEVGLGRGSGRRPWRAEEKQEEGHGNEEGRAGSGVFGDSGLAEEGGTGMGQRSSAGRR